MMKRYPVKKARTNSIRASFGKIDGDLDVVYSWNGVHKSDSTLLYYRFASEPFGFNGYPEREESLLYDLVKRGYDIRTLEFSITKLEEGDEEGRKINQMMLKRLGATE